MKVYPKTCCRRNPNSNRSARIGINLATPRYCSWGYEGDSQRLRNLILIYDLSDPRIDSGPYPLRVARSSDHFTGVLRI